MIQNLIHRKFIILYIVLEFNSFIFLSGSALNLGDRLEIPEEIGQAGDTVVLLARSQQQLRPLEVQLGVHPPAAGPLHRRAHRLVVKVPQVGGRVLHSRRLAGKFWRTRTVDRLGWELLLLLLWLQLWLQL